MSEELKVKLELVNFDGPLDLLLHLVKEEKIEVRDIFVSQVTAQFLEYMSELDTLDIDKASEYAEMAATLLEIKSRALLPVMPGMEAVFENPEKLLIRQLEEYRLFKEASNKLKEFEDINKLFKQPDASAGEEVYAVKDISLTNLLDAFAHILHKFEQTVKSKKTARSIKKDNYTVAERIAYIRDRLFGVEQVAFSHLFDVNSNRKEIVVTFIALLELLKNQAIRAEQNETFDEIIISKNDNFYGELKYDET